MRKLILQANDTHISDATLTELSGLGWTIRGRRATKPIKNAAARGQFSDGSRDVGVAFDETGRWLVCEDGFADAFDMDSRDWVGRPEEFACAIDARVLAHFSR